MSDTQLKLNQILIDKINSNKETIKAFENSIKKLNEENKKLLKITKEIENVFLDIDVKKEVEKTDKKECCECRRSTNSAFRCDNEYCINFKP